MRGLLEEISRLRGIREAEEEIDRYFLSLQGGTTEERAARDEPSTAEWQMVSRTRAINHVAAPVPPVHLENRYEALAALEEEGAVEDSREETLCTQCPVRAAGVKRPKRRKRRVIVIGDSILRGTEGPICRQDPSAREVYCLPGAKIQDAKGMLQSIIQPTDYYPMVLVHVGTNDAARRAPDRLMEDYHALGGVLREMGAQAVFSSILPVSGRGRRHEMCIAETNWRLQEWCFEAGFGFLSHDRHIVMRDMLGWDGLHLSPKGKRVFSSRLVNLLRRALN